jgi:hypothetical protein
MSMFVINPHKKQAVKKSIIQKISFSILLLKSVLVVVVVVLGLLSKVLPMPAVHYYF